MTDIWSELECSELKVFAKRHDLNVITTYDSNERRLSDVGNLELNDLETGENVIINTSSKKLRGTYEKEMSRLFDKRKNYLNSIGARQIIINNKRTRQS